MRYKVGDKVKIIEHSRMVVDDDKLEKIINDESVVTVSDFDKHKNDYEIEELKGFWFKERSFELVKRVKLQKSILLSNPQTRFEILDL